MKRIAVMCILLMGILFSVSDQSYSNPGYTENAKLIYKTTGPIAYHPWSLAASTSNETDRTITWTRNVAHTSSWNWSISVSMLRLANNNDAKSKVETNYHDYHLSIPPYHRGYIWTRKEDFIDYYDYVVYRQWRDENGNPLPEVEVSRTWAYKDQSRTMGRTESVLIGP